MENISNTSKEKIELNSNSISYLSETAKWSKFISIVGFVGVAILIILALFMGVILPKINNSDIINEFNGQRNIGALGTYAGPILAFFYLIGAVLYFFPILYLFNFSNKAQLAIKEMNNEFIESSLRNLKMHYKFIGIMILMTIILYVIFFIGAVIGGILVS